MKTQLCRLLASMAVLSSLWGLCGHVHAALGQAPLRQSGTPVDTPSRSALAAVQVPGNAAAYTQNTLSLDTGTVVHEFVNAQGLVFAVRWQGPVLPDFGALFGQYLEDVKEEAASMRASRKRGAPLVINSAKLVVASRGKMRQFSGHAYVPALVPAGVLISDLLR